MTTLFRTLDEEVVTLLLRAVDILKEQGWTQKILVNEENGNVCAIGSIQMANGSLKLEEVYDKNDKLTKWACSRILITQPTHAIRKIATSEIIKLLPGKSIATYNDAPDRTVEDIILLFEQAAANLKGRLVDCSPRLKPGDSKSLTTLVPDSTPTAC